MDGDDEIAELIYNFFLKSKIVIYVEELIQTTSLLMMKSTQPVAVNILIHFYNHKHHQTKH